MTEVVDVVEADAFSRDRALRATGLLADFNVLGMLTAADVHVAQRYGSILGETSEEALLALALVIRAVRQGSIRLDLTTVEEAAADLAEDVALPWPATGPWVAAVAASRFVAEEVLRVEGTALYLDRYWREEVQVARDLRVLVDRPVEKFDLAALEASALRVLPTPTFADQREAAVRAAGAGLTVLTGGPGTGKTTSVAALLAIIGEQFEAEHQRPPRIALAAPTGKAASRLQESVTEALGDPQNGFDAADLRRIGSIAATTLHRLLGWVPNSSVRFKHNRTRTLPYDLVVVDESSMVSLSMMARLLEALAPGARLVLVGDADQLASVEAGAVLADVVRGLDEYKPERVIRLSVPHRYRGAIADLATALRQPDNLSGVLQVLESADSRELVWIRPGDAAEAAFVDDVVRYAEEIRKPAERGDVEGSLAALDRHRLLCAHRNGPFGVNGWNHDIERIIAEKTGVHHRDEWYAGRPVLVTANDRSLGLYNGDMGVVVLMEVDGRKRLRVAIPGRKDGDDQGPGYRLFVPTRLPQVQTVHALTVHKAQGSQASVVSVIVPPSDSRLLTWELFYTAVTRAQDQVRVVGTREAIVRAVGRRIARPSGLAERLASGRSHC